MQNKRLDPSIVFPKRPKNAKLDSQAKCPGCYVTVKFSKEEDGDEVLAANCQSYCEKETDKWIDNPLCYAKGFLPELKIVDKPHSKGKGKKKSYYKKKKGKNVAHKNNG